ILLGGPQVGYAIPSFFFEVGLHAPGIDAEGVTPPAGPGMVIGRTRDFAYTITSGISDQVDTYLEVLNPANAKQYLFNGAYDDNAGTIAYFHAGIRPLRPNRSDPRFPLIGTGSQEWQGFLPKDQMPGIVNPAQGWLTNWNNNPIRGWSSADVRELWGTEHRVQALQDGILRELAADGKLSVDDVNLVMFQAAKKDEYAGGRGAFDGRPAVASPFVALSAAVDALPATDPDQASLMAGRDLMGAWINADTNAPMTAIKTGMAITRTVHGAPLIDLDGDGFNERNGAALYERWRDILQHRVFDDELGRFV